MTEAVCREKLGRLLDNKLINKVFVVGEKNAKGEYVKASLTVVVDSGDRIKGLSLAKLQSEIEVLMDTKVALYELVELEFDERLKAKITQSKPLVISR